MKLWSKKPIEEKASRLGVAAVAASGTPPEEWIREALPQIADSPEVERIGVWLETDSVSDAPPHELFRGLVWDRASAAPAEWQHLSTEAPLPQSVLDGTSIVEMDLGVAPPSAVLGPMLELRRALWAPIQTNGRLRGLILAGSR